MTDHTPAGLKILHVDDDHVLRLMTKTAITRSAHGFTLESCASAKEALEKLKDWTPDLLLIDMIMPVMNGVEFLRAIRQSGIAGAKDIPAIFMTGKEDTRIDGRSELDPVLGIIQKPFSPVQLPDDILTLLEEYRAKHQQTKE